jgi:membrane-bound ClpP family serine protease
MQRSFGANWGSGGAARSIAQIMDQTPSLSPFIYTGIAIFVVLALAMFAAVVFGPLGAGWLFGQIAGRLEPNPVQPEAMAADLAAQVGKQGVAKRLMAPSGQVQIEGRSYEAASEGPAIEAGQAVVVVKVATRRLVVRAVTG